VLLCVVAADCCKSSFSSGSPVVSGFLREAVNCWGDKVGNLRGAGTVRVLLECATKLAAR
jgi:hypothetical protein